MPKSAMEPINSSKNKLNSEIIFIFHSNSNAHFIMLLLVQCLAIGCVSEFRFLLPCKTTEWDYLREIILLNTNYSYLMLS